MGVFTNPSDSKSWVFVILFAAGEGMVCKEIGRLRESVRPKPPSIMGLNPLVAVRIKKIDTEKINNPQNL